MSLQVSARTLPSPRQAPAPGSALAGYWQGSDDSRHAYFVGQDGNVYELLFFAAGA